MNRRDTVLALFALGIAPRIVSAQQEQRVRRIGFFSFASAQTNAPWLAAFRAGMLELLWVEGRDYVIDARYANGVPEAVPNLAAEAIASQPDLLLTTADAPSRMLAQLTKTIPIVFTIAQDPVGNGFVASLRRPGGNATGLTNLANDLAAKRLQLLKEAFPRLAHVVLLFEPANVASTSQVNKIKAAAQRLAIRVTPIELRQPVDVELAFKRGAALGAQAYLMTQGGLMNSQRQLVIDTIGRLKVPALFPDDTFVPAGGLMSYGASDTDNFRRAATYVNKILKGAKPGDIPVEQPTKFELVLNMKTAKSMGLRFPQSFLVRADRVIE